jgi:hypothetical protein
MTWATMDIWMDNVIAIGRKRAAKALARGMNAPRSRCCGSFIYYSGIISWCLSCYSQLTHGWPIKRGKEVHMPAKKLAKKSKKKTIVSTKRTTKRQTTRRARSTGSVMGGDLIN